MKAPEIIKFLMLMGMSEGTNRQLTENRFFYDKFHRCITIGARSGGLVNLHLRSDESFMYMELTKPK